MVGWEADAHQSFWRGFGILLEVHRRRGLHEKASERPFIQSAEEACHLRGAEAAELAADVGRLRDELHVTVCLLYTSPSPRDS